MRKLQEYTCAFCNQNFTSRKKDAKFCSLVCSGKGSALTKGVSIWHPSQIEYLERVCGVVPFYQIWTYIRVLDRELGIPLKTKNAVNRKIYDLGLKRKTTLDNLSITQLAAALDLSPTAISRWIEKYNLPFTVSEKKKSSRGTFRIRLHKFKEWALNHEELLYGIAYDNLFWLLNDVELAKRLSQTPNFTRSKVRTAAKGFSIKRLDNGKTYKSMRAAIKDNAYITPEALSSAKTKALAKGFNKFQCGGIIWEIPKRA